MTTRELATSPRVLPLYLRTAAALVPGASHLPGVPGAGSTIPELEITLREVPIEPGRLRAYRELCGFAHGELVPCTFPHVLAFPLHMALMADGRFPFGAVGLVHVQNEIRQLRALRPQERLSFTVRATAPERHPRGRTFAILTSACVGDELVWSERSTMLRRERSGPAPTRADGRDGSTSDSAQGATEPRPQAASSGEAATVLTRTRWKLPGDLGRRYGAVSGDRNPIHMHALGGKAFGFPRAIAHGMWTKARCVAELEPELPETFTVDVRFRRPIAIPTSVSFECDRDGDVLRFSVRNAAGDALHLEGTAAPSVDVPTEEVPNAGAEAKL
jgi:acyl dehydratase